MSQTVEQVVIEYIDKYDCTREAAVARVHEEIKEGSLELNENFMIEVYEEEMNVVKEKMVQRLQRGETIYRYVESGTSMVPLIQSREPVDIRPVDKEIEKGDIVFARIGHRYYTHLVTAVHGNRVQISNNHGHVNGWTNKDKVYGIVTVSA